MRNLRCHESLAVDLGDRINFISGRNGSGKSSLLTAIILALGGEPKKATDGKGKSENYDSVIRKGCDVAAVEVEFSNEGDENLDAKKFGKSFT